MRVKKYRAHNMPEAMNMVRADLGPEAMILHSQKVRAGGLFGLFQPGLLEVIAAVDPDLPDFPQPTPQAVQTIQQLQDEISALKLVVTQAAQARRGSDLPASLEAWYRRLLRHGLADTLAQQIIRTTADELSRLALENSNILSQHLRWQLERRLPQAGLPIGPPGITAIVGPTGAGKTTTIAKLAASFSHPPGYHAATQRKLIVTIDTFRLAALPQITTFGEILGVPVKVAHTPQQLAALVELNRHSASILVDTPGCGPRAAAVMTELRDFLAAIPGKQVYLALAAGTRYEDMRQMVEAFRPLAVNGLIFTKTDETSSLGPAYTLACETGLPLSYLTTGQHIPDDFELARPERLVDLMIGPLPGSQLSHYSSVETIP